MRKKKFTVNDEAFNVWYWEGPKDSGVIHWAHANGFNGPTYYRLLSNLSKHFHVYAWDSRLHGLSQNLTMPNHGNVYDIYSKDLIGIIDIIHAAHNRPVILAGHSFGASLCVKAEKALRDKVSCIILADPVLFTPLQTAACRVLRYLGLKRPKELYLSQNALKRKNFWSHSSILQEEYSNKSLFRNWDADSLKKYVEYGTIKRGLGIQLACSPKIESQIFAESENSFLGKSIITLKTPTHLFLASYGSPPSSKIAIWKSKQIFTKRKILNSNHFFPVEKADEFSEIVLKILK